MSQDLSGGGRRAQRDKEFFPASESEVAKAKSPATGRRSASGEGERDVLPKQRDYKRALLKASNKGPGAKGSFSASLLPSASQASTVQIENSKARKQSEAANIAQEFSDIEEDGAFRGQAVRS
jgi:hypothetical protein